MEIRKSFNEGTLLYIGIKEGDSAPGRYTFSHNWLKKERIFQDVIILPSIAKEEKNKRNLRLRPLKRRCHRPKSEAAKIPEGVEIVNIATP